MKVVVNRCFGGFSLSPKAIQRLAELDGRKCYFFVQDLKQGCDSPYISTHIDEIRDSLWFQAFDIPNPNEVLLSTHEWFKLTPDQRRKNNDVFMAHSLNSRSDNRTDPKLVQVVEELGKAASGRCANLEVVEIPDDVDWQIDEYDGNETVREKSREW